MATDLESYLRRYLDDPSTIDTTQTPQQGDSLPVDENEQYYRKWLNDPNA